MDRGHDRDRSCRCNEMLERTQSEYIYSDETDREKRHQLVMYMKYSICGMGYTCHVLTGCPIKRFGTSSARPFFLSVPGYWSRLPLSREFEYNRKKNKGVAVHSIIIERLSTLR